MGRKMHKIPDIVGTTDMPEWLENSSARVAHPRYRDPLHTEGFGLQIIEPVDPIKLAGYRDFDSDVCRTIWELTDQYGVVFGNLLKPVDFAFGVELERADRGWHIDRNSSYERWYTFTRPGSKTRAQLAVVPLHHFLKVVADKCKDTFGDTARRLREELQVPLDPLGSKVDDIENTCIAMEERQTNMPAELMRQAVLCSGPTGWVAFNDVHCVHRAVNPKDDETVFYYDYVLEENKREFSVINAYSEKAE